MLERGVSPRVVRAEVVGIARHDADDRPAAAPAFGLYDTWATFTTITSDAEKEVAKDDDPQQAVEPRPTTPEGGTEAGAAAAPGGPRQVVRDEQGRVLVLRGRVEAAKKGRTIAVQRRAASGRWTTVSRTTAMRGGRYREVLAEPGVYRVLFRGYAGPAVRAR